VVSVIHRSQHKLLGPVINANVIHNIRVRVPGKELIFDTAYLGKLLVLDFGRKGVVNVDWTLLPIAISC
jgi:hypothetical protein